MGTGLFKPVLQNRGIQLVRRECSLSGDRGDNRTFWRWAEGVSTALSKYN